jgi:hypothetical protein
LIDGFEHQSAGTDPIAVRNLRRAETMTEALCRTFNEVDGDSELDRQPLYYEIDTDALDTMFRTADSGVRVTTTVWDHPVVITAGRIEVYDNSPPTSLSD